MSWSSDLEITLQRHKEINSLSVEIENVTNAAEFVKLVKY